MTTRDFCFWLQGFFELQDASPARGDEDGKNALARGLAPDQVEMIRRHLHLAFAHDIDPAIEAQSPLTKEQLDLVHDIAKQHLTSHHSRRDLLIRC